jgi:hypothetical protein
MAIFGLETGAQVVLLQGLSTYSALASAWYFAKPVLRGQTIAASKSVLSGVTSPQDDVSKLLKRANEILDESEIRNHPLAKRDNKIGVALLVVSLLLLTAAISLQVETDPLFHPKPPAKTSPDSGKPTP